METTTTFDLPTVRERGLALVRGLVRNRNSRVGLLLLVPIIVASLFGPFVAPHPPTEIHSTDRYLGPTPEYPFGTDQYGRDLLSRTLLGGRTSILMGFLAVMLALSLGVPAGIAAGFLGGRTDDVLMRIMDIMLSFPTLILALLVLAVLTSNMWSAILVIGLVYTPIIARIVRSRTLSVKNELYVQAALARGESNYFIMRYEILPNVLSPIIVEGSIRFGHAIIITSALSFLGLGAQPPSPDWGYMISESRNYLFYTPWFLLWPGLALGLTVIGLNLLGDGLRDVMGVEERGELL